MFIVNMLFKRLCKYIIIFSPAASKVYVPPPVGGIDIVFFGKVIGCTSGGRMPPLVSGEFFGPRVEKNMLKH